MIVEISPTDFDAESLIRQVDDFFRPGGRLQKACEVDGFPYEPRPQQRQMALRVAEALAYGRHLAVEAGTGVGKSFAYLVPVVLAAKLSNRQAAVSTYTISLQEQLIYKDIPFLQAHLGVDFRAALVKGRGNYLCLRRLARAERMRRQLFSADVEPELHRIREWSRRTPDGSLQDFAEPPPPDVWEAVNVEPGNCLGHKCPEYAPCFLFKARREMRSADLLVLNHHLLFSDLALQGRRGGFLPDFLAIVIDEAHMVENVASDHLGVRLSRYQFDYWLRRLFVPDTGKGLLGILKDSAAAQLVVRLGEDVNRFFAWVKEWAGLGPDRKQRVVHEPLPVEVALLEKMKALSARLRVLRDGLEDLDLRAELAAARRRGDELAASLEAFLTQSLPDSVYWIELEGARRPQPVFYSAPIEVGPILRQLLFSAHRSVVLTSATLAVHGNLDYFIQRVGADGCDAEQIGSPFDYERQMRVWIPSQMPDPSEADKYLEAVTRAVRRCVHETRGRAFVLFTAERMMRAVADRLRSDFEAAGYELLVQGEGLSRRHMIERFRNSHAGVLFGLDSFWMGVDVRGEALSNVIITKLPFAVPEEPLAKARMERIQERGGDPFREYSLPEAILKFRQGVGRLIRSQTDQGIVVILDPRVKTKGYGRWFLNAIPECPIEIRPLAD
ncbi:MAG: hypothetical protein NZ740_05605 [Kiritimatiellae bacterium]|nr:hypothetical protein [Kiritimatiellia bacterium]MDW8458569.1 helicase C-terminal domain-containing protein [Verrucomicrobiota bacterium]